MFRQHYRALTVVAIAILVAIGVLWLFAPRSQPIPPTPHTIAQAAEGALSANPRQAISQARAYLATDPNGHYAFSARTILALESLNAATSAADVGASIALLKQNLALAPTPKLRAAVINQLVRAVLDKRVSHTVIFQDPPLSSYLVQGQKTKSLRKLIQYSLSLAPSADAYTLLARQEADLLILAMASSSLASTRSLDARASAIEKDIRQADTLAPEDISSSRRSPYAVTIGPALNYWRGYALAAASRVHSADALEAKQSYLAVIQAGQTTDASGNTIPTLEKMATYSELSVARLLYSTAGKARAADIRTHLKNYVTAITAHPEWYDRVYDNLSSTAEGTSTSDARIRKQYKDLAAFSPEFAAFLKAQGWQL